MAGPRIPAPSEAAMSTTTIMLGLIFGLIGLGFFRYGRRRGSVMPLVSGIALMVFPCLVPNAVLLLVIGVILAALPYFVRV